MQIIKLYRKQKGLTQTDMAKKLNISQQAYALYEKEGSSVNTETLKKISLILGVDISKLVDENCEKSMLEYSISEFLSKSYTSYHATDNAVEILKSFGFKEIFINKKWELKEGDKCYIKKNGSAFLAFKVGKLDHYAFNIASCHTDSPSLKVKGNSLISSPEGKRINVEKYGGPILYSFFDIPLKVAGRLLIQKDNQIINNIYTSDFTLNIPSLCIHHSSNASDGMTIKIQSDMLPLLGECDDLFKTISKDKILDADLYCVPFVKPIYTGLNDEFLTSPRIDNLTSLFSIIMGLGNVNNSGIAICYASDNEEIGSLTKQGAESNFIIDVLKKINDGLNKSDDEFLKAKEDGFILSIDNGHATHPGHPEKSDVDQKVYLNKGIVIKHHTNYSTDGLSSAILKSICEKNKIPYQEYYNNSDIRCGSTIGNILSAKLSMNSVDIGLAQLAMHSAIETVGVNDIKRMEDLVKAFYLTKIIISADNCVIE